MNLLKQLVIELRFRAKRFGRIGQHVDFRHLRSKFVRPENIFIGSFSKIGEGAYLDGSGGIEIGYCSILGPNVTIITSNHNYAGGDFLPYNNHMLRKKVVIEDFCWIGRDVKVVPGVTIGRASVVAMGSVVTRDVLDYSIVGGNPATLLKKRDIEKTEMLISQKRCVSNPEMNAQSEAIWK